METQITLAVAVDAGFGDQRFEHAVLGHAAARCVDRFEPAGGHRVRISSLSAACNTATVRPEAGVAELADAQDLKSWVPQGACGFDARPRHSQHAQNQWFTRVSRGRRVIEIDAD